jgi:hypothetical protein
MRWQASLETAVCGPTFSPESDPRMELEFEWRQRSVGPPPAPGSAVEP